MILRADEPTPEQIARMRTWDPVLAAAVAMPFTTAGVAVDAILISMRFERALLMKQWAEAELAMDELRTFVALHGGGAT